MPDVCSSSLTVCRMKRLTFGVTSSPFLATEVLRKVAQDCQDTYPQAAEIIRSSFYVDDVLTGAPSEKEAIHLREQLNKLLKYAGMILRKWRCSSPTVLAAIPEELREKQDLYLSAEPHPGCKALGVHWKNTYLCLFLSWNCRINPPRGV